ncbi:MAG TPA: AbrB/MazE/SpoVT family DNA-binding domain-containing protein, partial [Chloroflexi bacterium]|nr:AbrB/MazE/SpoVT family DNA-binding domain-containing protein [Chloroflexota bacterium]
VILEERQEGLFLRPAAAFPVEIYTPERKAEFLLNNAVTPEDYRRAVEEVSRMGLAPEKIPHEKPR